MKSQNKPLQPAVSKQPKLQIIYSGDHQFAAVHLISAEGITSYASLGTLPRPRRQTKC